MTTLNLQGIECKDMIFGQEHKKNKQYDKKQYPFKHDKYLHTCQILQNNDSSSLWVPFRLSNIAKERSERLCASHSIKCSNLKGVVFIHFV